MHTTIIKTKDGKELSGSLEVFKPEEGWMFVTICGEGCKKFYFDDLISAVTKGERLSVSKIGDCDEIERARKYLTDGRKFGWFKKEIPIMDWEKK